MRRAAQAVREIPARRRRYRVDARRPAATRDDRRDPSQVTRRYRVDAGGLAATCDDRRDPSQVTRRYRVDAGGLAATCDDRRDPSLVTQLSGSTPADPLRPAMTVVVLRSSCSTWRQLLMSLHPRHRAAPSPAAIASS